MDPLMLGRRLRASRIASGFDDPDYFAQFLGVRPQMYRRAEAGTAKGADLLSLLIMVGEITNRSLDFLVRGREWHSQR